MNEVRITTNYTKTADQAVAEAETTLRELNAWLKANGLPELNFRFNRTMWTELNPFIQEMIPWSFDGEFLAWSATERHLCDRVNSMFGNLDSYRFVRPDEIPALWGRETFHSRSRGNLGGHTQSETLGYKLLKRYVPHSVEVKYRSDWTAAYQYDVCTPSPGM